MGVFIQSCHRIIEVASTIVLGKKTEIQLAVVCILADGHLLIEDVPGVGKTTLVQTLGKLLGLHLNRIQFTVDLLPSDILGGSIYNQKDNRFETILGPLFAELIIADELNRASPRTQGALLQAMEERIVTIESQNYPLPKPFFVIATQNPHNQMGTFPLPESQLDRFLMSLELDYAPAETEKAIMKKSDTRNMLAQLQPLMSAGELLKIQSEVDSVVVSDKVAEYVVKLLENSRQRKMDMLPVSTRGGLSLIRAAKAWAYINDRKFLIPEDIQFVAGPVLGHRLGGNYGIKKGRELCREILQATHIPV